MMHAEHMFFRRGLALGMTLAEMFTVVVFVLLLLSAVLLRRTGESRDEAQAKLLIATEMMQGDTISWANADAWYEEAARRRSELDSVRAFAERTERELLRQRARAEKAEELLANGAGEDALAMAEQVAVLRDSVDRTAEQLRQAETQRDSLGRRLRETEPIVQALGDALAGQHNVPAETAAQMMQQASRADRLERELNDAHRTINALDDARREAESHMPSDVKVADSLRREVRRAHGEATQARERADSLARRISVVGRERDQAQGRLETIERELESLRMGIDPPPCWVDERDEPEPIFAVTLTNQGVRTVLTAGDHRLSDDVINFARAFENHHVYPARDFRDLAMPIYSTGVRRTAEFGPRGCRFYVELFDETSDDTAYRVLLETIEGVFFYWRAGG